MTKETDCLEETMNKQKKYLPLLVDASKLVHKFYFETGIEVEQTLQIIGILTDDICDNVAELPED